jgi:hypothetical protein
VGAGRVSDFGVHAQDVGGLAPAGSGLHLIEDSGQASVEDGNTRLDIRFDGDTVWFSPVQLADLFGVTVPTINHHITKVLDEGELPDEGITRNYLIIRQEGSRQVSREITHYNLDMIISVGYRVRRKVATHFRIWATKLLKEYITKGFTIDDERLKVPDGIDYFGEMLARIRAIRASELRFYQKVRSLFAQTSADYDKSSDEPRSS